MPPGDALHRENPLPIEEGAVPTLVRDLYDLAKPRLTGLVVLTAAVGYFLAFPAGKTFLVRPWLMTLLGTGLVSAAASVINQWIERERDQRMPRTRNRPFATGRLDGWIAAAYAIVAGFGGLSMICIEANHVAAGIALLTLVLYVAVYTPLKTRTSLNTIVGAVPGALPPLIGWSAASGELGPAAWSLFVIVFLWQVPHFLAIATMYREDYRAGGYRMMPVDDPTGRRTGRTALLYALMLTPASFLPAILGIAGPLYTAAAGLVGLLFVGAALRFEREHTRARARQLFLASLVHLPVLLIVLCFDAREIGRAVVLHSSGG